MSAPRRVASSSKGCPTAPPRLAARVLDGHARRTHGIRGSPHLGNRLFPAAGIGTRHEWGGGRGGSPIVQAAHRWFAVACGSVRAGRPSRNCLLSSTPPPWRCVAVLWPAVVAPAGALPTWRGRSVGRGVSELGRCAYVNTEEACWKERSTAVIDYNHISYCYADGCGSPLSHRPRTAAPSVGASTVALCNCRRRRRSCQGRGLRGRRQRAAHRISCALAGRAPPHGCEPRRREAELSARRPSAHPPWRRERLQAG